MSIRAAAWLLALAALLPWPAEALEFRVQRDRNATIILASGPFERGDAQRLSALLRQTPNVDAIIFRSPGGNAMEGMEVGRVIRRAGLATHLPAGVSCASACTYAFIGGTIRTMEPGARFGVHMFSASNNPALQREVDRVIRAGGPRAAAEVIRFVEEQSARFAAQLAYYAIEMGVSLRLLEPNFRTAHDDIHWLSARELRDLNVVNAD